ncbi:uncharacterized protein LOC143288756 [Babylonia areolata]|uniref:uncharacterized protein LOC143288756 n=1 Tax=Babylonia areolata TaxID=304850 RepID=UPI003FD23937
MASKRSHLAQKMPSLGRPSDGVILLNYQASSSAAPRGTSSNPDGDVGDGFVNPIYASSKGQGPPQRQTQTPSSSSPTSSSSSNDRQPSFNNLSALRHLDFAPATAFPGFRDHGAKPPASSDPRGFEPEHGRMQEPARRLKGRKGNGSGPVFDSQGSEEGEWRRRRRKRVVFYAVLLGSLLLLCTAVAMAVTLGRDGADAIPGWNPGPSVLKSNIHTHSATAPLKT